eukprot:98008_1
MGICSNSIEKQNNDEDESSTYTDTKVTNVVNDRQKLKQTKQQNNTIKETNTTQIQYISVDILNKCKSIQSICNVLQYYETLNNKHKNDEDKICEELIKYIDDNKESQNIINDYHYILTHYLNKSNPYINEANFEYINTLITQSIHCKLSDCKLYKRNRRDIADKTSNKNNAKAKVLFYVNLLDNIHSYFVHSYDNGCRIRYNQNSNENSNDVDKKENKEEQKTYLLDKEMEKLKQAQKLQRSKSMHSKAATTYDRIVNNKFFTNMNDTQKDEKTETLGEYSFGQRYYYWEYYKHNVEKDPFNIGYCYKDWYINPKYNDMKSEILENINIDLYNEIFEKANQLLNKSNILKSMKVNNGVFGDYLHFGIQDGQYLLISNILSILFYTDTSDLSYDFSLTFRKKSINETNNSMKNRNSCFYYWSKILNETVNLFGNALYRHKIPVLYHGVSKLMYFDSFVTQFCSPTSMTRQLTVAVSFCGTNGVILELTEFPSNHPRYFNCSIISRYPNEDERLFIGGFSAYSNNYSHCKGILRFKSIRTIKDNSNYFQFVSAFTVLNLVLRGITIDTSNYPKKISWYFKVIKKLIENKIDSDYIKSFFDMFKQKRKEINIKIKNAMDLFGNKNKDNKNKSLNEYTNEKFLNINETEVDS